MSVRRPSCGAVQTARGVLAAVASMTATTTASAQAPPPPGYTVAPPSSAPAPGYAAPYGYAPYNYGYAVAPSVRRSASEITVLYATAAAYGVGLGVYLDAEIGVEDPAAFMIAPAVLGVLGPVAVYVGDHPSFARGIPAAISAGAVIGAGEGIGLASLQFVTANKEDAWGFRGLARSTAIGATLGAVGGAVLGYAQRPSPRTSALLTSSIVWGSAVGAMFGYGASPQGQGYGRANDHAARGGFIGYNVGLVAAAAVSTVYIPTTTSLEWMWGGAGIGFVASLPVFLFYARDGGSPAKRGLLFSGTATTLGLAAGALFTADTTETANAAPSNSFAEITAVAPLIAPGSVGVTVGGLLL